MLLIALVSVPLAAAALAYLDPRRPRRNLWLVAGAVAHLGLVALAWQHRPEPVAWGWLAWDDLGGVVLSQVSVVFTAVAMYAVGWRRREDPSGGRGFASGLLGFLAAASVVTLTRHFGLLWVGMEATTLATAPLLYDPADRRSLEAVWKYLVVCSVGIALGLLGTFFLATAQLAGTAPAGTTLLLTDMLPQARHFHPAWLRAAFAFLLIGFGTKMGLAPMHTWLPDAHGEAPSPVSALLSGALLNCAFLAILRGLQVMNASGEVGFARPLLMGFGLLSLLVAAAFLYGQENYKRMLAYSSVEHMGIMAIGIGVSGVAAYGALLHLLGCSLAKAALFMAAGNVLIGYHTKQAREVSGVLRALPMTGFLFVAGLFAITGSPPFVSFLSEITMLSGAVRSGALWVAITLLVLQATIFLAMGSSMLRMALGPAPESSDRTTFDARESPWLVWPPAALLAITLALGLYLPAGLQQALARAVAAVGGAAP
jgi:hydrogenase-4 component F